MIIKNGFRNWTISADNNDGAEYVQINDEECLDAFYLLPKVEGIIPALESSHAVAYAMKLAKEKPENYKILVNLSGRGDKDMDYVVEQYGMR